MDFLNHLLPTFTHFGIATYWLALLAALVESLAFVGLIIPGSSLIIIAGFAAAQGIIDVGDLIFFVAIGAIIGDGISYYMGTKGTRFFKTDNKLLKISHLEKGKEFFKKHGPKSILLGRFVAPLRAIVPFIAGASRMNLKIFILWNVLSGILWAVTHVLLGYFFGNAYKSIEVWITKGGAFLLGIVVISTLLYYVVKRSRPVMDFIISVARSIWEAIIHNKDVERLLANHPKTVTYFKYRLRRDTFIGLPLTIVVVVFVVFLFTFLGITEDVITSDPIVSMDKYIASFLSDHRSVYLIQCFLFVTLLGKGIVVTVFGVLFSLYLLLRKRPLYIAPLFVTLLGAGLTVTITKLLIHRDRPGVDIAYYFEKSLSFPSGHAAISVTFYGFLGYYFMRKALTWKTRTNILFTTLFIVFLIGLSRLYLGVHYFSDVLGGYVVGMLWLLIGITITETLRFRLKRDE